MQKQPGKGGRGRIGVKDPGSEQPLLKKIIAQATWILQANYDATVAQRMWAKPGGISQGADRIVQGSGGTDKTL
jgi:hypothetical protein